MLLLPEPDVASLALPKRTVAASLCCLLPLECCLKYRLGVGPLLRRLPDEDVPLWSTLGILLAFEAVKSRSFGVPILLYPFFSLVVKWRVLRVVSLLRVSVAVNADACCVPNVEKDSH